MSLNFMPYLININILKCHKLDRAAAGKDPGKVVLLEFVDIVEQNIRSLRIVVCLFTARKRSLRRLCFYTYLSVHRGEYLGRYPPGQVQPPGQVHPRQVHPPGQVHPMGRYTPQGRYTPRAGTHPGQVHPP